MFQHNSNCNRVANTTTRRGNTRTSASSVVKKSVSSAVDKMQCLNVNGNQHNHQSRNDDDDNEDGGKNSTTNSSLNNNNDPNCLARSGFLSLATLYNIKQPPAVPADSDDASAVMETADSRNARQQQAEKSRLQIAPINNLHEALKQQRPAGGFSSSEDESVAADRQRRVGKRKVKLRASDLGLTEAELKSLNPKELQERIQNWKRAHPKAAEDKGVHGVADTKESSEMARGRELEETTKKIRSRSRADVKRRSRSTVRRSSEKDVTKEESSRRSHSSRGKDRLSDEEEGKHVDPASARRRSHSRRTSGLKTSSLDDDNKSLGTTVTETTARRRGRSIGRRGGASVVSIIESVATKSRHTVRCKSLGRPTISVHKPSALGAALDKVSSHRDGEGDRKKKKEEDGSRAPGEDDRKLHYRSKSIGHVSSESTHRNSLNRCLSRPTSPSSSRESINGHPSHSSERSSKQSHRQRSPEKSPNGSHRRSRSSAPPSRRDTGIPQFGPAISATFEADPFDSTPEFDSFHDKAMPVPVSPPSLDKPNVLDTLSRSPGRALPDKSPSKMSLNAFQKIRGVFGSKSFDSLREPIAHPERSPDPQPSRGSSRSKSGGSIFEILSTPARISAHVRKTEDSPHCGVLRQPSGGISDFATEEASLRTGRRNAKHGLISPEKTR